METEMNLENNLKISLLAFTLISITMVGMRSPEQPITKITILTSDEKEIEIAKNIAFESSLIRNMAKDLGETDPVLLNITAQDFTLITAIQQSINNDSDTVKFKRKDGNYIAQRIQPLIDQALASAEHNTIAHTIYAAEYLDLRGIANGAIRVMVHKALGQNPNATIENIKALWPATIYWPISLNPILEYQYQLVKNGNIPELSVKDYIAINDKTLVTKDNKIDFDEQGLTSLEGLNEIPHIASVKILDLSDNQLTTVPANIFNGFTNLEQLRLDDNKITKLSANTFSGLTALYRLFLQNNMLSNLDAGTFNDLTNIESIDLSNNKLKNLPSIILRTLQYLYLNDNELESLDAITFNDLKNLKTLYLQNNKLKTFDATIFNGLISLAKLILSKNKLKTLPVGAFNGLRALGKLDLSNNEIETLPATIFNGFTSISINLNHNQLDTLPATIFSGIRSGEIHIRDNPAFKDKTAEQIKTEFNITGHVLIN